VKALTLTQPWASLVALGAKRIETRSWATRYRGLLAIHAAAGLGPVGGNRGLNQLVANEPFWSVLQAAGCTFGRRAPTGLPFGAIVAVCRLVGCVPTESLSDDGFYSGPRSIETGLVRLWKLTPQEKEFGDYRAGRFAGC
jgi:hypothetical protein